MPDFSDDFYRMTGKKWNRQPAAAKAFILYTRHELRYMRAYRALQRGTGILNRCRQMEKLLRKKYGLALDSYSIGKGLYLGHPYNIYVSRESVIGDNCNLHKGVRIETVFSGPNAGAPVIGDRVWIGANAVISGRVRIGDNVLIAPNSVVTTDVPSCSIVLGNPAEIHTGHPEAVDGYINFMV